MSAYQELLEQKNSLDEQIAAARKTEAEQALKTGHALIAEFGFRAQQMLPWKAVQKVQAEDRDPQTGATWNGRGRAPKRRGIRIRDSVMARASLGSRT